MPSIMNIVETLINSVMSINGGRMATIESQFGYVHNLVTGCIHTVMVHSLATTIKHARATMANVSMTELITAALLLKRTWCEGAFAAFQL